MSKKKKKKSKRPASGTKEWSVESVNCCNGCSHRCIYCYAAWNAVVRHKRLTREQWPFEQVREQDVQENQGLRDGQVMFPSTHDITPANIDACETVLLKLLAAGNQVLIVSKPHRECISRLVQSLAPHKDKVLFRFTIGVVDEKLRAFWEPGAPSFTERLACLELAHEAGFATSVSAEPLLEPWVVDELVEAVRGYVSDAIWIGKLNLLRTRTLGLVSPTDPHLVRLEDWQTDDKVRGIYQMFRDDPMIKWKESYKKVIGLDRPTEAGLDI